MSTRTYTLNFAAPGSAPLPQGVFFMVKSATGPLTITANRRDGQPVIFENVGAGLQFDGLKADVKWSQLIVQSASIQVVEIVISDDAAVSFPSAVSVTGTVVVQQAPVTGMTASPADVAVTNGNASNILANPSRKTLTIGALAANTGNLRVQTVGAGASKGRELQPGQWVTYTGGLAYDVRNDSGATQSYWIEEET